MKLNKVPKVASDILRPGFLIKEKKILKYFIYLLDIFFKNKEIEFPSSLTEVE